MQSGHMVNIVMTLITFASLTVDFELVSYESGTT